MDSVIFPDDVVEKKVFIVGSELVENYTVYIIEVSVGQHKWAIKHRYSDFHDLHEKLTAENKIERHLLPPKKMIGKNSKSLVEKRQKELEVYLQTLLVTFPVAAPKVLSCFLHFHRYEINGITAALAEELFHQGEHLLGAGEVFLLRPLQLYAITQQLKLAKPTCANGDAKADLGHILDFTCRLKYLKITGTRGFVGTSNIQEDSLTFDLSVFKALLQIEISDCSSSQIVGLPTLKPCLATLNVHRSVSSMMDLLVPEAREFPLWVAEGVATHCPVTTIIPAWKMLTTLDMSHNHIRCIDDSVKLIRKVEVLDLSYNDLSMVDHLQHLYNLIHLDLSYNSLTVLEGVHTKLGNIKTLNLAGNKLVSLAGLTKLYSLVNLDVSSNQLGQLEEIRYIGPLPCLEKLNLANNPLCIIPDYRTKVLAQFCDRASEMCLDGAAPTEKELDTVEVLKAIQKAKEAKDRMSNNEKKMIEDSRRSAGESHKLSCSTVSAASSSSSSVSSAPASTSAGHAHCSQDVICREDAVVTPKILTPVDFALDTPRCNDDVNNFSCEEQLKIPSHQPDIDSSYSLKCSSYQPSQYPTTISCSCLGNGEQGGLLNSSNLKTSLIPVLCSTSPCPVFTSLLADRITQALGAKEEWEKRPATLRGLEERPDTLRDMEERPDTLRDMEERPDTLRDMEERPDTLRDTPSLEETYLGSYSPSAGDGYFEMGLGKGDEVDSSDGPAPPEEQEEPWAVEEELVQVTKVMWCHCVRVGEQVDQRCVCVVLTERFLVLFHSPTLPLTDQTQRPVSGPVPWSQRNSLQDLVDSLLPELVLPYDQIRSVLFDVPDTCLSLRMKSSDVCWFLFSDPKSLTETQACLCSLARLAPVSVEPATPQQLLKLLRTSWEFEENQDAVKGGYAVHLVETAMLACRTTVGPPSSSVPCVLFLTQSQVYVLKVDFQALASEPPRDPPENPALRLRSCTRLTRIPLGSILLHPRVSGLASPAGCPLPGHQPSAGQPQVLDLLVGWERVTAAFPLPYDRLRFQRQFSALRLSLRDIKAVAFLQGGNKYRCGESDSPRAINVSTSYLSRSMRANRLQVNSPRGVQRPLPFLSLSYPTDRLLEKLAEDNQVPSHLSPGLSPAQHLLSGLQGQDLVAFFHTNISEIEEEELVHILWSSVVFYKSPDIEVTSCIMLSTKALYFLLNDTASTLSDQSLQWDWRNGTRPKTQDPELIMSYSFTMKLNDLHSVNVGLFDQYFRVVGPSAETIICCLTRDSYGTHYFLQQLMSVLSLQEKLPSPEPSEQDFYTQFGNKTSGKMKNYEMVHSSKVTFIYPSEEEIGDLTFIVAERKGPPGASPCNILLYVLVFQVQTPVSKAPAGLISTGGPHGDRKSLQPQSPVSASQPRLHPNPLSSNLASHPLPQAFPSEPFLHPKTLVLTSTDIFLLDEDYISYPLPDFAKEPPPRDKYHLTDARRIRDLDRILMGYQTYPQALTLVFDDVPGPDLLCHLTMDHFGGEETGGDGGGDAVGGAESEVQWCVYIPGADSRERLICLLARQWEMLCSRELPVELTG
ncbi:hypothetical protein UPYG_G00092160 [Umbra pygmaea]|uniref:PX domain-containing protein n=1 Tax=Umbra pygmaea TaxID=75934 RepID=A0ABD0Y5B6_UMBPY